MKELTVLNKINTLIENINYTSVYVEIRTKNDKYVIEKEKSTMIIRIQKSR